MEVKRINLHNRPHLTEAQRAVAALNVRRRLAAYRDSIRHQPDCEQ